MNGPPRFLLGSDVIGYLAAVDSSYGECAKNGSLALYVDYRNGVPLKIRLVRMQETTNFLLHPTRAEAACVSQVSS